MNYSSFTFLCINESTLDNAMQMMQPDAMMPFIDDGNASSCDVNNTTSLQSSFDHHRIKLYHLHLGTQLVKYIFPFILLFGTIGNALSMVVLRRKAMRTSCSSAYLYSLAIADMTVLYLSGFKTWLRVSTGFELLHVSDATCRLIKYGFYTATHLSALLIVIVTIERLLVVYCPIRAADAWIVRRPHLTTWLAAIAVLAVNANIIWASELVMIVPGKWLCATYGFHDVICDVISTVNLFLYSVVPSIIVFSCNIVIIYVTVRAGVTTPPQSNVASICSDGRVRQQGRRRRCDYSQRRLTFTLLTLSTLWLVLSLPYSIIDNNIVDQILPRVPAHARVICYLLMYVNHSINFYVYCLLGRKFRTELQRTFRCRPSTNLTTAVGNRPQLTPGSLRHHHPPLQRPALAVVAVEPVGKMRHRSNPDAASPSSAGSGGGGNNALSFDNLYN